MAYTITNFKTKKALIEAVERGNVRVYQPGPFDQDVKDGRVVIEGPHFPEAHRWYASVEVKDNTIPKGSKIK